MSVFQNLKIHISEWFSFPPLFTNQTHTKPVSFSINYHISPISEKERKTNQQTNAPQTQKSVKIPPITQPPLPKESRCLRTRPTKALRGHQSARKHTELRALPWHLGESKCMPSVGGWKAVQGPVSPHHQRGSLENLDESFKCSSGSFLDCCLVVLCGNERDFYCFLLVEVVF